MRLRALAAILLVAAPALAWLDGWIVFRETPAAGVPPELRRTLADVSRDLARRSQALALNPEISRSLSGGGIAVDRERLFASARQAVADAPPGSWIAFADPQGNALAWWGDAPASIPQVRPAGTLEARWSATRMELLY